MKMSRINLLYFKRESCDYTQQFHKTLRNRI